MYKHPTVVLSTGPLIRTGRYSFQYKCPPKSARVCIVRAITPYKEEWSGHARLVEQYVSVICALH